MAEVARLQAATAGNRTSRCCGLLRRPRAQLRVLRKSSARHSSTEATTAAAESNRSPHGGAAAAGSLSGREEGHGDPGDPQDPAEADSCSSRAPGPAEDQ